MVSFALKSDKSRHAAVYEKTVPEAVVACFQDPGRAAGGRWDNPGTKQEMEGFAGRRMGVYSEPLEGQNGISSFT